MKAAERELEFLQQQARSSFEDDLSREYRQIIAALPAEAFFEDVEPTVPPETLGIFYRYFDLSNEQLFLGDQRRVSPAVLDQWKDGIAGNLQLPIFDAAWKQVSARVPENFFKDLDKIKPRARRQSRRAVVGFAPDEDARLPSPRR